MMKQSSKILLIVFLSLLVLGASAYALQRTLRNEFTSFDACSYLGGYWDYDAKECKPKGQNTFPSTSPTATPLLKTELTDEEQKISDSFCAKVRHNSAEGIYYLSIAHGQGIDWLTWYWCFTKDGTRTMTLSMENGVMGDLQTSYSPKSYLTALSAELIKNKVGINISKNKIDNNEFGTCHGADILIAHYGTQNFEGSYQSACGRESDPVYPTDPNLFSTNLEGSYTKVFDYIEKITLWSPDHLPQFSDFPATIWHGTPSIVDFSSNPDAKRFYTQYTTQAAKGPNFAGRYTIVTWGCGTSCTIYSIVDATTGSILLTQGADGTGGIDFHADSNLLVVHTYNVQASDNDLQKYYLWKNDKLELLYQDRVAPKPLNDIEQFMLCREPFYPTTRMRTLISKGAIPPKPIQNIDGAPYFIPQKNSTYYGLPVVFVSAFDMDDRDPLYIRASGTLYDPHTKIYVSGSKETVEDHIPLNERETLTVTHDYYQWKDVLPDRQPTDKPLTIVSCSKNWRENF